MLKHALDLPSRVFWLKVGLFVLLLLNGTALPNLT